MNKQKMGHLPVNLVFSLPLFLFVLSIAVDVFKLNMSESCIISLFIYFYDALNHSKTDYLEEEIKNLKNK